MQRPDLGAFCEYLEPAHTGTVALHLEKKDGTSSQRGPG